MCVLRLTTFERYVDGVGLTLTYIFPGHNIKTNTVIMDMVRPVRHSGENRKFGTEFTLT